MKRMKPSNSRPTPTKPPPVVMYCHHSEGVSGAHHARPCCLANSEYFQRFQIVGASSDVSMSAMLVIAIGSDENWNFFDRQST